MADDKTGELYTEHRPTHVQHVSGLHRFDDFYRGAMPEQTLRRGLTAYGQSSKGVELQGQDNKGNTVTLLITLEMFQIIDVLMGQVVERRRAPTCGHAH
ncbi:hypothetical protein LCGC14_3071820 [marine sediment metagenome]|uniref:Uncharacterized protein n=1 Tax=marine sediment metagenome TaxID=412755 RepID=A0A0F8WFT9_9ZZZZ